MNFTIPWRSIAIAMAAIALSLMATLSVVVTRHRVDFLSTLALSLAIISFFVQIILFVAQSSSATQQLLRAEELHTLTTRALATIEEKTEGTRLAVSSISDRMLEAVLGKVVPEAAATGLSIDSPEFRARLTGLIQRQLESGGHSTASSGEAREDAAVSSSRSTPLPVPTGDRLASASTALDQLDVEALDDLRRLATDFRMFGGNPGRIKDGLRFVPNARQLYERGLVRRIRVEWEADPVYTLTQLGRDAAALLSVETVSSETPEAVVDARRRLQEHSARLSGLLRDGQFNDIPVEE